MNHKEIEDAAWEIKSAVESAPAKCHDEKITEQVQRMKAAGLPMKEPSIRDLMLKLSYYANSLKTFAPAHAPDQAKLLTGLRRTCDAICDKARRLNDGIT